MRNKTTQQNKCSTKSCGNKKTTTKTTTKRVAKSTKTQKQTKSFAFANTRPKTMVLTVERTANGYTLQEATLLNKINQYSARPVSVDIRSITADINKKGFIA
jgi:hypothetical protein